MLSKAKSDSRLRRSKSSASVKRRHQQNRPVVGPLDPQTARQHALTAASLAMQRQRHAQRLSVDSGLSFDPSYGTETDSIFHPHRGHSVQSSEGGRSLPSNSLADSRSSTPLRTMPLKEASLDPVPEVPTKATEFGFLEDGNVPSEPSSYRRLRKSKSMFATGQRHVQSSPKTNNRSPAASSVGLSRTTLRRSLSFFKGKGGSTHDEYTTSGSSDAAVQLARDQFLQTAEKRPMSNISPSAYSNRRPQQHRPFRKSFRSTNTDDNPINQDSIDEKRYGSKTRLFSLSIKKGFRRLFGRSFASQDAKHSTEMSISPPPSSITERPRSNASTVIDSSRPPPLPSHAYYPDELVEPPASSVHRPASLRTMKSSGGMSTASSRISSWTDSTAANTINAGHGGKDYNQLSVIRENSGSQWSGRAPSIESRHDGYSVFRQPLQSIHPGTRTGEVCDSQRVYSALMREIDRSNAEKSTDDDATPRPARTKKRGIDAGRPVRSIRQVPSSASIPQPNLSSRVQESPGMSSQSSIQRRGGPRKLRGSTPQQMAHYNETTEEYQTQVSPYSSQPTVIPDPPRTPTRHGHVASPLRNREMSPEHDSDTVIVSRPGAKWNVLQSPSVYSRNTSGCSLREPDQSDSSGDERGTATILTSHRVPYSPTKQVGGGSSNKVAKGSAEWKQWMSSQLDIINTVPMNTSLSNTHYRENAEINDDGFQLQTCTGGKPSGSASESQTIGPEREESEQTRRPLAELTLLSQNNFSRPLRRTPSGPMSIRSTSVQKPSVVTTDHSPSAATVIASTNTMAGSSNGSPRPRNSSKSSKWSPLTHGKARRSESPRRSPSTTQVSQHKKSPSALRSLHVPSATSSYSPAEPKRHGPITLNRANQDNATSTKENQKLYDDSPVHRKNAEDRLSKLEGLHSTIKNKRMVDLFLSDRRRMMGSEDDNDETTTSEPAFL